MSAVVEAEKEIRERVLLEHKRGDALSGTLAERWDIVVDELRIIDKRGMTHQERWEELAPSFAWNGGPGRDRRRVAEALAMLERSGELERWIDLAIEIGVELAKHPRKRGR